VISPFLYRGVTNACFQSRGMQQFEIQLLNTSAKGLLNSVAQDFKRIDGIEVTRSINT
jgi:hypothetical protein